MEKTAYQRYTDQERISQLVHHNFEMASGNKRGRLGFNHVFIDLERTCNLACHGCFEHMDKGERIGERLVYKEITRIIDFAYDRAARVVIIAGAGEPTLDPDFRSVIEYIHSRDMYTIVFTNGTGLDEDLSNFLFDNNTAVAVKQFSMNLAKQDYLIGKPGMSKLMRKGLETLMQVKGYRSLEGKNTSEIGIESYISIENMNSLGDILRFCRRNDLIPYLESFITRGQDEQTTKLSPSQKQLNRIFQELAKIDREEFGIKTPLRIGSPRYGGSPCMRGKASFAVHTDGSIYECVSGSHEFGNIRQQSLGTILSLRNPKVKEFYSDTGVCASCCLTYQQT